MFYRIYSHLAPRAAAWRLKAGKNLRKIFEALASASSDSVEYADTYLNHDPQTTTELAEYQKQFGLFATGTEQNQRDSLFSAWQQQGGQSPRYLQACVQAAGFNVWIHEWWQDDVVPFMQIQCGEPLAECGEPRAECGSFTITRFVRNPFDYADQPLIGTVQCGEPLAACGEITARCNRFLVNETHYLVNKDLTQNAPPPIPDDPATWPYFLYWGGETFPDHATVSAARRDEFERLILKLCPTQQWLVTLVDYS